ncbi:peptidyl-glycine alpha-amidating monooxygenase B isoform X2 [Salarias fasciatus]|uniref:peptidyl-glycine alpha-amidating monooxygenase B isoform X2 n=1 Tax=Salarias fasciatus TaxID=181472 RepID=UPI001176E403|nr:peptidyl-glycine alpha-amidating monooxygenase isoform X2 [Salarias fasciatus]
MMGVPVLCVAVLCLMCHSSHGLDLKPLLYASQRFQDHGLNPGELASRSRKVLTNPHNFSVDIHMPGVTPTSSDTYLCMSYPVPTSHDAYIVDFIPHASMSTVHHMLLFGCQTPASTRSYWDCGGAWGTCKGASSIMYAWARDAPPTKLPKDVGFKVGKKSKIYHFVLQIHYGDISAFKDHHRDTSGMSLRMTTKPQPFTAGIYLLMSVDTVIPPGKTVTNADIACDYASSPMYPFAFRTHTHRLGKVVSGYRVRDGKWSLIGRQSPQLPQAFYPATKDVVVESGDTLAARCVFTGEGRTSETRIGGTSDDEMCNFYIMYYMDSKHAASFMTCMDDGSPELFQHIPAEANVPIAISPGQMSSMMHMGHAHTDPQKEEVVDTSKAEQVLDQGDLLSLVTKLLGHSQDVAPGHRYDPGELRRSQAALLAQIDSLMQKKDLDFPGASLALLARGDPVPVPVPVLVRDRVHRFHQLEATAEAPAAGQDFHFEQVAGWPQSRLDLGQVSGLALDSDSNLVIFHRGDHRWEMTSFNMEAQYLQRALGPIQQSAILVVDPATGRILKASGRDMFYLPHGITTDQDNNYWVTDVALHQVLKVSSDGGDAALLTLGEAFVPGSDSAHFCQPTDVAVDPASGNVFVSDGYCNSRILKFTSDGRYLTQWGAGSSDRRRRLPFQIPHSLAFLPDKEEVCVADRENGRIQCFLAGNGEFVKEIKREEFGGQVFAITYSPAGGGLIFAVNGGSLFPSGPVKGFVIDYSTKEILDTFSPDEENFQMPHDIVEAKDGSVFVGDADSQTVFKFTPEKLHRSVKKAGIEVQELEEVETFVQTRVKPDHNKSATVQQKQTDAHPPRAQLQTQSRPAAAAAAEQQQLKQKSPSSSSSSSSSPSRGQGLLPAVITTLLLVPLLLVVSIGLFICWRRNSRCEVKSEPSSVEGILGKIRGKAVGSLNLGNFFASHKGYSRQGFDQLSTEGSDQERNEDSSDSENEEYSAPPPQRSS